MNKEEQEAMEYLNKYIKSDLFYEQEHYNRIKIVLNLIDKLQKENELMKKELDKCSKHIIPCMLETSKDYISKDKIRDKIKELEGQPMTHKARAVLKELLEEE